MHTFRIMIVAIAVSAAFSPAVFAATKCVTKTVEIIDCGDLANLNCRVVGTKQVTECTSDKSVVEFGDPELSRSPGGFEPKKPSVFSNAKHLRDTSAKSRFGR